MDSKNWIKCKKEEQREEESKTWPKSMSWEKSNSWQDSKTEVKTEDESLSGQDALSWQGSNSLQDTKILQKIKKLDYMQTCKDLETCEDITTLQGSKPGSEQQETMTWHEIKTLKEAKDVKKQMLEDVIKDVEEINIPLIVNFQYGPRPLVEAENFQYSYFRSTSNDINFKKERHLIAEKDRMGYFGSSADFNDADDDNTLQYMIGIYDDELNEVELVDAEYYCLQTMAMDEYENKDNIDGNDRLVSVDEKSMRLVKEFGSSKGKRLVNSRQRNELRGKGLQDIIQLAVTDMSEAKPEIKPPAIQTEEHSILPIYHHEATRIEDAYLISDIIYPAEEAALFESVLIFSNASKSEIEEWRQEKIYPAFILDRLEFRSVDDESTNHKLRCLLYLHYMFTLFDMKANEIRKLHPLSQTIPEVIRKKLLEKFTAKIEDSRGKIIRCMPKRLRDSLILHMLLLCLIMDGYHTDCTSLKKELQLSDTSLKAFVGSLGGKIYIENPKALTDVTKYYMMLHLPLNFNSPNKSRTKMSRRH